MSRRERFRDTQLLLPRVLHADGAGSFRPLDYDRDILGALDWGLFSIAARADFTPDDRDRIQATFTQVEMTDNDGRLTLPYSLRHDEDEADVGLDFAFMVRQLVNVVPNPWHAARILEETLAAMRERERSTSGGSPPTGCFCSTL